MRRKSSKMIQIICFILALTCLGTVFSCKDSTRDPTIDSKLDTNLNETCSITVDNKSKAYFQSRIEVDGPNFIYFYIRFNGIPPNSTGDALFPNKWVRTYATSKDVYPFMHWRTMTCIHSISSIRKR